MRHILNYGHTVVHAIETLSGYTISHGEAVAIGLCIESNDPRIDNLLRTYGFEIALP